MKTRFSKVLACLFAGILTATAADYSVFANGDNVFNVDGVKIVVVPNTIEYKKNADSYLDEYGTDKPVLTFSAARNERESGQIMLYSKQNIDGIKIEINEDLKNVANKNQTIPAKNIEIFYEQYVNFEKDNVFWLTDIRGYQADPLLPKAVAENEAVKLNRLDTTNGNNQGIWFTLTVPDDAPKGKYTGTCAISWSGQKTPVKIDVEVNVYDFNLPDQTQRKTFFNDARVDDKRVYNEMAGFDASNEMAGFDASKDYADNLQKFLNTRKVSSGWTGYKIGWQATQADINAKAQEYADKVFEHVSTSKSPYYQLELSDTKASPTDKFDEFDFKLGIITVLEDKQNATAAKKEIEEKEKLTEEDKQTIAELEKKIEECDDKIGKYKIEDIKAEIAKKYDTENDNEDILGKFSEIKKEQTRNSKATLTENERKAIKFAVETYLYYDVKFYFYMLDENDPYMGASPYYTDKYNNKQLDSAELLGKLPSDHDKWLERLYYGIMNSGETEVLPLVRNLKATPRTRFSQYDWKHVDGNNTTYYIAGFQTLLQALAEKSLEKEKDILQYAYFYSSQMDEEQPEDFWGAYELLTASKALDDSKQAVKAYINKSDKDAAFKARLINSLDNIPFLITVSPVKEQTRTFRNGFFENRSCPAYSSVLYKGLQYFGLGDLEDFYSFNIVKENGTIEKNTITVPKDYTVHCFCPLFNDYSETTHNAKPQPCAWEGDAKDYRAVQEAMENPDIHLWWYSCNSDQNAALASYIIGGNHGRYDYGEKKDQPYIVQGNSLAISRANAWQQFTMGIEGELYWAVDDYKDTEHPDTALNQKVWTEASGRNGGSEGVLVYPIYQLLTYTLGLKGDNVKTIIENEHFASSIRLEVLSDSNDDYDYLRLAEQLIGTNQTYRNKLDSIIKSLIVPNNVDYKGENLPDSDKIVKAREDLARLIEELSTSISQSDSIISFDTIENWNTSNLAISFDFKVSQETKENSSKKVATVVLLTTEGKSKTDPEAEHWFAKTDQSNTYFGMDQDSTKIGAVTEIQDGWYNYSVPLSAFSEYKDQDDVGDNSVNAIAFRNLGYRFLIRNFKIVSEIANSTRTFTLAKENVPDVPDWHNSGKSLSFNVCKTNTLDTKTGSDTMAISLIDNNWQLLNEYINIHFKDDGTVSCDNPAVQIIPIGNGWSTIMISLDFIAAYADPEDASKSATGNETLTMVGFNGQFVNRSFFATNFQVNDAVNYGDLNCDGELNLNDIRELINILLSNIPPSQSIFDVIPDFDHNGRITAADLTCLKRMLLNYRNAA